MSFYRGVHLIEVSVKRELTVHVDVHLEVTGAIIILVITLKPYEHIEIKENPEMLMVHYNIIILLTTAFSQL